MLTLPDLNRLKVFHAVYVAGNIVRAAETLHVTRSAVSQSLKALEGELRTSLFERDSKKVRPTAAAEALYKLTSGFLTELEATVRRLETGRTTPTGRLRLGAPLDFGSGRLTEAAAAFRARHPDVSFEIVVGVPVRQLELLLAGKLDLAFIDNGDVFAKTYPIAIDTVASEEFVLVAAPRFYSEHIGSARDFQTLRELPFVDYLAHAPVARMWFKHHFAKSVTDLDVVHSIESVRGVMRAIELGVGVGVVPRDLARAGKSLLRIVSTERRELVNRITLAQPLGKRLTRTERAFVDFLRDEG